MAPKAATAKGAPIKSAAAHVGEKTAGATIAPSTASSTAKPAGKLASTTILSSSTGPAPKKLANPKPALESTAGKAKLASPSKPVKGGKTAKPAGTVLLETSLPPAAAPEPELTEEEQKARVAQALEKALADTQDVRQQAWKQQMEAERRKEAARRKKAEEEARRKKEEARVRTAALEAAYDDDVAQLQARLAEAGGLGVKQPLELCDSHGNTLLSEAAAGGALGTLQWLLTAGADPNSQGEFKRTPLWRAAFLGHTPAITPLLEAGADPRITNEQGEVPRTVASQPAIKQLIDAWDTTATDSLVAAWQAAKEAARVAVLSGAAAAVATAYDAVARAEQEHARTQQALRHARQELEKRITEHDMCVAEHKPDDLLQVTLSQIHDAETMVGAAQREAAAAQDAVDVARLALREQQDAERHAQGAVPGVEGACGDEPGLPGTIIAIKDLDDVLIRDVGGKLAASGKWALVVDSTGQACVFLRYLDTNYVNALSPQHTQPERLRRSLLGAIRYGKPLVIDCMDVPALWEELPALFDRVQPGLLADLMNKSLLANGRYLSLVRPEDGEEYEPNNFQDARVRRFSLIVHTSAQRVPQGLVDATSVYRIPAQP